MVDKYESLKLKNQLCFPIYLCAKELVRRYTPILDEIDLTYTQYVVMMYFWEKKSSNVKEVSNSLLLDSSTLTPILKKLEKKGFITRERSSKDERNLIITLTEKGDNLKDKALRIPEDITKCVNLTEEESKVLYNLLYKTINNIEKEIE